MQEELEIDTELDGEDTDEKKRRSTLTVHSFYEALTALALARASIQDSGTASPVVIIASIDGKMKAFAGEYSEDFVANVLNALREESVIHVGEGVTADAALADLLGVAHKDVEDLRNKKYADLDEYLKSSNRVLKRARKR